MAVASVGEWVGVGVAVVPGLVVGVAETGGEAVTRGAEEAGLWLTSSTYWTAPWQAGSRSPETFSHVKEMPCW